MSELTVLVPSRGRPQNVERISDAWIETGAFDRAQLLFILDADDPEFFRYQAALKESPLFGEGLTFLLEAQWRPMVPKLNRVASAYASISNRPLAFMGDDHLPRTQDWVTEILRALETSPRIVSSPDGLRTDDLPTWWAMTADVVRALGCMVPGEMEHLYCDNAVRDVARAAGIYSWLPDVMIEHMHPHAGKAEEDEGYATVNSTRRYREDQAAYLLWLYRSMKRDVAKVRSLCGSPS